jgi:rhodanese-related sulfurtransferase
MPDEFRKGHIPGAINIPIDELANRLSEITKEKPIVSYCNMQHRGNSRGEKAAQLLKENGFEANVIDGGFVYWNETGLPIQKN